MDVDQGAAPAPAACMAGQPATGHWRRVGKNAAKRHEGKRFCTRRARSSKDADALSRHEGLKQRLVAGEEGAQAMKPRKNAVAYVAFVTLLIGLSD